MHARAARTGEEVGVHRGCGVLAHRRDGPVLADQARRRRRSLTTEVRHALIDRCGDRRSLDRAVDHEPRGVVRELEVALAHALVEGEVLGLEAVLRVVRAAVVDHLERHVEQDRQRRPALADRQLARRTQQSEVDPASVALVGEGRGEEAVTHDRSTCVERRLDDAANVVGAVGQHDERLGRGLHRRSGVEHPVAQVDARGACRPART